MKSIRGTGPAGAWTLVLAIVCGALLGLGAQIAVAHQHWHATNGIFHGFVHAGSQTDGYFESAVEYTGIGRTQCQIDTVQNPNGYAYQERLYSCLIRSNEVFASATECKYRSETSAERHFTFHHNRPDNYCG